MVGKDEFEAASMAGDSELEASERTGSWLNPFSWFKASPHAKIRRRVKVRPFRTTPKSKEGWVVETNRSTGKKRYFHRGKELTKSEFMSSYKHLMGRPFRG